MKEKFFHFKEDFKNIFSIPEGTIQVISGLRGISILMIILFHSFLSISVIFKKQPEKVDAFLESIYPVGWMLTFDKAVDIFFLVSGFLLGKALIEEYNRTSTINLKRFFNKRFFRIYPMFFTAFVLYSFTRINSNYPLYALFNLVFLDNIIPGIKMIIPVGWSLAVEMQFYLFLPFLIILLMKNRKHAFLFFSVLFAASIAVRSFIALQFPVVYQTPLALILKNANMRDVFMEYLYYPTYSRFAPLVFGILLGYTEVFHKTTIAGFLDRNKKTGTALLLLSFIPFIAMLNFPSYIPSALYYQHFNEGLNFFLIVNHRFIFTAAVFIILMISFNGNFPLGRGIVKLLSLRFWEPFSLLTFPMYLFHFPFVGAAAVIVFGTINPKNVQSVSIPEVFSIFFIAVILTFLFSSLMHILVEKPFMDYGRKKIRKL